MPLAFNETKEADNVFSVKEQDINPACHGIAFQRNLRVSIKDSSTTGLRAF